MRTPSRTTASLASFVRTACTIAGWLVLVGAGCGSEQQAQAGRGRASDPRGGVRPPAVSGRFYHADPRKLEASVQSYLKNAERRVKDEHVLALMVPHAGHIFSGQTAAWAFKQVESKRYSTVVLIGCPHTMHLSGASVYPKGAYRTPIGDVPIDEALAAEIARLDTQIRFTPSAHEREHSLEVELPFLQVVLKGSKIVPILIGHGEKLPERLADAVARAIGSRRDVLVVASSDMTHYPSYKDARRIDRETLQAIATFSPEKVRAAIAKHPPRSVPNLACVLCGDRAVLATMMIAGKLGANRAMVLDYSNSGDSPIGSDQQVVGYGAAAFVKTAANPNPDARAGPSPAFDSAFGRRYEFAPLSGGAQLGLLDLARDAIAARIDGKECAQAKPAYAELLHCRGVFVTILMDGQLRGCIGHHMDDEPLYRLVPLMAIAAAFRDRRFSPLTKDELSRIKIKVSCYSCRTFRARGVDEFKVGEHGIIMVKGRRGATFLPEVAVEQGWDKPTVLKYLCRKAGLSKDGWKEGAVFYLYKTQRFGM